MPGFSAESGHSHPEKHLDGGIAGIAGLGLRHASQAFLDSDLSEQTSLTLHPQVSKDTGPRRMLRASRLTWISDTTRSVKPAR